MKDDPPLYSLFQSYLINIYLFSGCFSNNFKSLAIVCSLHYTCVLRYLQQFFSDSLKMVIEDVTYIFLVFNYIPISLLLIFSSFITSQNLLVEQSVLIIPF